MGRATNVAREQAVRTLGKNFLGEGGGAAGAKALGQGMRLLYWNILRFSICLPPQSPTNMATSFYCLFHLSPPSVCRGDVGCHGRIAKPKQNKTPEWNGAEENVYLLLILLLNPFYTVCSWLTFEIASYSGAGGRGGTEAGRLRSSLGVRSSAIFVDIDTHLAPAGAAHGRGVLEVTRLES